jgi:hypothetical protein
VCGFCTYRLQQLLSPDGSTGPSRAVSTTVPSLPLVNTSTEIGPRFTSVGLYAATVPYHTRRVWLLNSALRAALLRASIVARQGESAAAGNGDDDEWSRRRSSSVNALAAAALATGDDDLGVVVWKLDKWTDSLGRRPRLRRDPKGTQHRCSSAWARSESALTAAEEPQGESSSLTGVLHPFAV